MEVSVSVRHQGLEKTHWLDRTMDSGHQWPSHKTPEDMFTFHTVSARDNHSNNNTPHHLADMHTETNLIFSGNIQPHF